MSLGQSRRFGSGITNLYCEKDDAMEAYDYKKMKQKGMKVSLMAVDQYRDSIGESIRRKEQRKGELSKSSSKIGSVPAAYMDTKRNKWVPWDASEFQMQREREEIWQRLKHKTSIGSKTLSSLHITDGRDTEHLNPITHLPDAKSPTRYGKISSGVNISYSNVRERAYGLEKSLERSLSLPSFVPSKIQVLKPFTLAEFQDTDRFIRRNARQSMTLPTSPIRRLNSLPLQQHHNEPLETSFRKTMNNSTAAVGGGLVSLKVDQREQLYHALMAEEKRTSGRGLFEDDVLRICNIYFIPVHHVKKALDNATSIRLSGVINHRVNVDVFMNRLCGKIEKLEERIEENKILNASVSLLEDKTTNDLVHRAIKSPSKKVKTFNDKLWLTNEEIPNDLEWNNYNNIGANKFRGKSPKSPKSPKMSAQLPWKSKFNLYTNTLKTSGTQTDMYGEYGTNLQQMETIVSNYELRKQVQFKVHQLLKQQKRNHMQSRKSRNQLHHELIQSSSRRSGGGGGGGSENNTSRNGLTNGGVGRSSGGGATSNHMKGVFDYSTTEDEDSSGLDKNNDFNILNIEEKQLTKALKDSIKEVKKCRNALNIASGVVSELRHQNTKLNKKLVKQSFRRKNYRSGNHGDDSEKIATHIKTEEEMEIDEEMSQPLVENGVFHVEQV
jgi:hypothetical protein